MLANDPAQRHAVFDSTSMAFWLPMQVEEDFPDRIPDSRHVTLVIHYHDKTRESPDQDSSYGRNVRIPMVTWRA
jgi:hypothetical protein